MRYVFSALAIMVFSIGVSVPQGHAEMTVHFIDVGQGGGVLIQRDGKNIMYDCGDKKSGGPAVTGYLNTLGLKTIHLLIVSHAHLDHMAGCMDVLNKFIVKKVYHNGSDSTKAHWTDFKALSARKSTITVIDQDRSESGLEILVAYDSRGKKYKSEADNSILVRVVDNKVKVLLTGDCEKACEKEISDTSDVKSDVLSVGHHGSNQSSSQEFLEKVKPMLAVIQAGVNNRYQHPRPEVLNRLEKAGVQETYRTDWNGNIILHSDGNSIEVENDG